METNKTKSHLAHHVWRSDLLVQLGEGELQGDPVQNLLPGLSLPVAAPVLFNILYRNSDKIYNIDTYRI